MATNSVIEKTKQLLKISLFTPGLKGRWGLPTLFMGKPGIGKSHVIEALCGSEGLLCKTLVASIREPADFAGLPVPVTQGKETFIHYAPPAWTSDFLIEGDGRGVIFLDEITTCAPAVQAALLRLVLDGALGDYTLSKGVRFISAANSTEDAAGGWDLSAPLANRFGHLNWELPEVEDFEGYLIDECGDEMFSSKGNGSEIDSSIAKKEEQRVIKAWPESFARAKGKVIGFLRARREFMFKMPEAGKKSRSAAWPSHRTWEMAVRASAGCEVHKATQTVHDDFIAAFVGSGPAREFRTYLKQADLPDPADVLDGRVKFKHNPKRIDISAAILAGCAALVG